MQIELKLRELVTSTVTVGVNIDNVEAAGLDPTSADDMLVYVQQHMDPAALADQLPKDYSAADVVLTEYLEVSEIDLKARDSAVA